MTNIGRRILLVLVIVYIMAFLGFLGWSFFDVPAIRLDSSKRDWIFGNALVLFARNIIPLHLAAVLFGFSLFFSTERAQDSKRGLFGRFKLLGIVFIVLLAAFTVLREAGLPFGIRLRDEAVGKILRADDLRLKARDASSRGQLRDARRYLQYALVIFPEDEDLRHELDAADRAVKFARGPVERPPAAARESPLLLNMTFDDFLTRAQNAFDREDYISAEYYAGFALRMDDTHPVPRRIIARAIDRVSAIFINRFPYGGFTAL